MATRRPRDRIGFRRVVARLTCRRPVDSIHARLHPVPTHTAGHDTTKFTVPTPRASMIAPHTDNTITSNSSSCSTKTLPNSFRFVSQHATATTASARSRVGGQPCVCSAVPVVTSHVSNSKQINGRRNARRTARRLRPARARGTRPATRDRPSCTRVHGS